ncbi:hypothetical protein J8F10_22545 [Gemmata sp. G18]|uniref:Serine/threonine protein kinase n=1 Tax=Gemmata palustris TaxID=2822762 RepID=A0ABS5BWD8_9BACT|nr:hypothetical protein [Gemmata palustris]MBP3958045.1 hypothetical protein [Gemmata palustris]
MPRELAAVLDQMMAPAPADRFPSLYELEDALAALAVAGPQSQVERPPLESLLLSRLQKWGGRSGAVSRHTTEFGDSRPVARDDSDGSVTFDLPEVSETVPDATPGPHCALEQTETRPNVPTRSDHAPSPAFAPSPPPAHSGNRTWRIGYSER